ncbi:MAG: VWA domain-containing protein [Planctomycetes bacterium]|nr:VWA domain-containing protein [Planctomycetota bacterium]
MSPAIAAHTSATSAIGSAAAVGEMAAAVPGVALQAPGALALAVLVVAAAAYRNWRRPRVPFAGMQLLADAAELPPLPTTWRARLSALPAWCELLAALALVVALARPVERVPAPTPPPGRDLLLCLDISSSMAASDLDPQRSRHAVGQALAERFVRARASDRIGLVAFARYADLVCPPTRDHEALVTALRGVRMVSKDGAEDATAIGAAVGKAAASLAGVDGAAKVVIVVTDGEENVSNKLQPNEVAPLHAAQACAAAGIRVHAVVVGRGNQKPDGRFVALDTTAVQQLASTTGGRSWLCEDEAALAEVYALIDALEADATPPPGVVARERFAVALLVAAVAAALARLLRALGLRRLP